MGEVKGLFWNCARSTIEQFFKYNMKKLENDDKYAFGWLNKGVGPEHWCKAFFSFDSKCDIVINNHS